MSDRIFIQDRAQHDPRVWPLAIEIARALVQLADTNGGDGVGFLDLYVTEGLGSDKATHRYISITLEMPAAQVDAALAKVGIRDADPLGDAQSQRAALLELE